MDDARDIFQTLVRHRVPFAVIGGHAVSFHGYIRITEDADVVWLRTRESERQLLSALAEIGAHYIGNEIDPTTRLEVIKPVTASYLESSPLMMLQTNKGFLDLFDYIPGVPDTGVEQLLSEAIVSNGIRYTSLAWLRKMKEKSGRTKDRVDLENLPDVR